MSEIWGATGMEVLLKLFNQLNQFNLFGICSAWPNRNKYTQKFTQKFMQCVTKIVKNGDIDLFFTTKVRRCMTFVVNFGLSMPKLISADLHYHQFRIVVDSNGQDTVAEASGDDQLHAVDVVASFIHLGEDLVFG